MSGVIFIVLVIVGGGINMVHDPLGMGTHITIIRSIMGTVATTSIMKQISTAGSAFSSMSMGDASPAVVLGTCLILASGVIPMAPRSTAEGTAIYMGVQYAYADVVMAAVPWQSARIAIAAVFVVLGPMITKLIHDDDHNVEAGHHQMVGPASTLISTISFVGVSFAVDAIMPLSIGSAWEDLVRGICAILLLHVAIGYVPHLGKNVEGFASWLIARRFSTILSAYGRVPMFILVGILLSVISRARNAYTLKRQGVVMGLIYDLLILVETFLVASWALDGISPGSSSGSGGGGTSDTGFAVVLMLCAMSVLVMVLKVYHA